MDTGLAVWIILRNMQSFLSWNRMAVSGPFCCTANSPFASFKDLLFGASGFPLGWRSKVLQAAVFSCKSSWCRVTQGKKESMQMVCPFCKTSLVTYLTTFGPWPCYTSPPSFPVSSFKLYAADGAAGALAATVQLHPIMHWLAGNELAEGPSSPTRHNTLINRELLCWIIHFLKTIQQVIEESSKSCRSCHNCHFHREASGCCLRDAKRTAAPGVSRGITWKK